MRQCKHHNIKPYCYYKPKGLLNSRDQYYRPYGLITEDIEARDSINHFFYQRFESQSGSIITTNLNEEGRRALIRV